MSASAIWHQLTTGAFVVTNRANVIRDICVVSPFVNIQGNWQLVQRAIMFGRKGGLSENVMLESAPTLDELAGSLADDFHAKGIEPEFATELARELAQEFAKYEVPPPDPGRLGFLVGHYAIRKDDFKIFDALTDGLKAAAAVSFFTSHQPVMGANVALGVSLAKLLRSIAMRGAMLDRDSVIVLSILKSAVRSPNDEGLTLEEIVKAVSSTRPDADLAWVQKQLNRLKDFPTRDGAAAKLASDSAGRWRPHA